MNGSTLVLGAIFFTFQIYCDFSGYSDIAIGTARLFGFNLMQNFAFPYFSRDIAEFWRRWHISLSTWFRDYLYIPLGGSRGSTLFKVRNIFVIFLVSGFWHGANWTYIFWGGLNALYFLPLMLFNKNKENIGIVAEGKFLPSLKDAFSMLITFSLIVLAWIFFRAEDLNHAFNYVSEIFSLSLFSFPSNFGGGKALSTLALIVVFMLIEWLQRDKQHTLDLSLIRGGRYVRWGIYLIIILAIISFGGQQQEFIYFQF
tara:strand:- start:1090 stop:1860 length:771 start_codon:yes stop_codon:yes gene_type:complete